MKLFLFTRQCETSLLFRDYTDRGQQMQEIPSLEASVITLPLISRQDIMAEI
jgi:hypothetical protein